MPGFGEIVTFRGFGLTVGFLGIRWFADLIFALRLLGLYLVGLILVLLGLFGF